MSTVKMCEICGREVTSRSQSQKRLSKVFKNKLKEKKQLFFFYSIFLLAIVKNHSCDIQ